MAMGTVAHTWFQGKWHEGNLPILGAADHGTWLGSLVFDGAHMIINGDSFGQHFHVFAALIYGIAFMRTRSLLAPFLFHAGGNLCHALLFATSLPSAP